MKRNQMAKDRKVNILGKEYTISFMDPEETKGCIEGGYIGFCDRTLPTITICDLTKHPGWKDETKEKLEVLTKETIRHEIIHAFFNESGLKDSAATFDGAWCTNEEMVDWIAIQGPKIVAAWKEAGCL